MSTKHETTVATITTASAGTSRPEFLRLPPPGAKCPLTGMSRSALNGLVLASEANGFKPAVKSFCLRKKGARTGIRLVDYSDLARYIRSQVETAQAA